MVHNMFEKINCIFSPGRLIFFDVEYINRWHKLGTNSLFKNDVRKFRKKIFSKFWRNFRRYEFGYSWHNWHKLRSFRWHLPHFEKLKIKISKISSMFENSNIDFFEHYNRHKFGDRRHNWHKYSTNYCDHPRFEIPKIVGWWKWADFGEGNFFSTKLRIGLISGILQK